MIKAGFVLFILDLSLFPTPHIETFFPDGFFFLVGRGR